MKVKRERRFWNVAKAVAAVFLATVSACGTRTVVPFIEDLEPKASAPLKQDLEEERRDSLPPFNEKSINLSQSLPDSLSSPSVDTILQSARDSLLSINPSVKEESDSTSTPQKEEVEPFVLPAPVAFSAQDSMVMVGSKLMYLFGPGNIEYEKLKLEASFMRFDVDSSQVYAQYILDSVGYAKDLPRFSDGDQTFESKTMKYNFRTEQGFITGVTTKQGEAFLTSDNAKRLKDNTMYLQDGRFTTCDNHNHPHFYINLTKAKVKPNDKLVTGPVYLVLADVPIYLFGLPFGFFPFNEKRTSGIVPPQYGMDQNKGLYLRNGGMYLNFNDYFDVALRGEIYTDGSWGVSANSNYQKRYKYNGSLSVGFLSTASGDKAIPGSYSRSRDFSIAWSHRQDAKADPLRTFSAQVNFATSSYNHNSTEALYNTAVRAHNNKGSSISYTRRFVGIPLSLSGSFSIDQRSRDSTLSVTLPNLSISLSSVYPFKRKARAGQERWYEKITLSYSGSLRNSITTKEHLLFKSQSLKEWKTGMQHNVPISASFDLFNYIKVSPSINYSARWYTNKTYQRFDPETQQIVQGDTVYGFYHLNDFSASLNLSTTLYGFFKPWKIFGDYIQMIRHRISPSISLSYAPDFGTPFWGYYETLHYQDNNGLPHEHTYSPFERNLFGVPGRGRSGAILFSVDNNIEMKVRNKIDSVANGDSSSANKKPFRKISLIDQLSANISYNMAADSFKWSNLSSNIALRLSKTFVLRLSGSFDTYLYDYYLREDGTPVPYRVDKLRILNGKGLGRLIGTGTSFSYTFNNNTINQLGKWFSNLFGQSSKTQSDSPTATKQEEENASMSPPPQTLPQNVSDYRSSSGSNSLEYDRYGYLSHSYPWTFSFNYSLNMGYNRQKFDIKTKEYPYMFTQNLSFNGSIQPTANWYFSFDANYNFDLKKITNMTINITRDMHCWQLTGSVIPFGPYKSFNVTISVKSQILQGLKWNKASLPGGEAGAWY